eukprot:265266-Rhodomonas_salina.2
MAEEQEFRWTRRGAVPCPRGTDAAAAKRVGRHGGPRLSTESPMFGAALQLRVLWWAILIKFQEDPPQTWRTSIVLSQGGVREV